jgi:hypothetical protein
LYATALLLSQDRIAENPIVVKSGSGTIKHLRKSRSRRHGNGTSWFNAGTEGMDALPADVNEKVIFSTKSLIDFEHVQELFIDYKEVI